MAVPPAPIPVAIRLADDLVLRGHEWASHGPVALFVHDVGADLDSWDTVTRQVAAAGFRAISVELPGHGLSDGEFAAEELGHHLAGMLREITGSFGPVATVGYGSVAELMLRFGEDEGAPVQIMISPSQFDREGIDHEAAVPAMRLILSGTLNEAAHGYVESIYPKIKGQRMLVTGASDEVGPALLLDQPSLLEHLTMFLRKYLVAAHLQWIAENSEQIKETAERLREAAADE